MVRDFLAVHWLRLHASNAGAAGSIPGWGTKIPHAAWRGQKTKEVKQHGKSSWAHITYESSYRKEEKM